MKRGLDIIPAQPELRSSPGYLPDRPYFTPQLDIRGFLHENSAIENRLF
jgi:hypothetical protein